MKLTLTRQSVAMGDDVDAPHELSLKVPSGSTLRAVLGAVIGAQYLPSIRGGKATWSVLDRRAPLAVIAQEWDAPRFIASPETRYDGPSLNLHFDYHAQQPPELIFESLRGTGGGSAAPKVATHEATELVFTPSGRSRTFLWVGSVAFLLAAAASIGFAFLYVDRMADLGPHGSDYIAAAAVAFVVLATAGGFLLSLALRPPRQSLRAKSSRRLGVGEIVEAEDARHL
jgi:hypothetical protein